MVIGETVDFVMSLYVCYHISDVPLICPRYIFQSTNQINLPLYHFNIFLVCYQYFKSFIIRLGGKNGS